jgi:hypothetical protein
MTKTFMQYYAKLAACSNDLHCVSATVHTTEIS